MDLSSKLPALCTYCLKNQASDAIFSFLPLLSLFSAISMRFDLYSESCLAFCKNLLNIDFTKDFIDNQNGKKVHKLNSHS